MNSFYLGVALATGAGVAVMTVINARLGVTLGTPFWAALTSFTGGLATVMVVALASRQPAPPAGAVAAAPWWLWTGGAFSATFILVSAWLAPRLGVALTLASILVGQMLAALFVDHYGLFGGTVVRVSPPRVFGVALLLAGLVLLRWRS